MCRWLAYSGSPILIQEALYEGPNSLVNQSLHSRLGAEPTNGVQETNCHPFRHNRWLFMHNGYINEFAQIKRDLILSIDPTLYPEAQGQADTEVLFYLALTFGLEDYPNRQLFADLSDSARLIVSEPLGDVAGVWNEVPESSWGVIGPNGNELRPFRPRPPATAVPVVA